MLTAALIGYAAVALLLAVHAIHRLPRVGRRRTRLDAMDRLILRAVALAASAAWALLLPVYLAGWVGSPRGRALAARMGRLGDRMRSRMVLPEWVRHVVS